MDDGRPKVADEFEKSLVNTKIGAPPLAQLKYPDIVPPNPL
jgi:hypothetical protein